MDCEAVMLLTYGSYNVGIGDGALESDYHQSMRGANAYSIRPPIEINRRARMAHSSSECMSMSLYAMT